MPSESTFFTPSSILFRPHWLLLAEGEMVETPGTAPGSDGFIAMTVYRHSPYGPSLYRRARSHMQTPRHQFRAG